jgi:NarL family two-component system response regulator LiaR
MSTATPIRVLVVDDHAVVRSGLIFVLQSFDDIQPVGEASSVESALQECEVHHPHVVLMDMKMAGYADGIEATRLIRQTFPDIRVIALTSYHDPQMVEQAIQAGALGYLLKDVTTQELAQAIRLAQAGTLTLAPEAAQDLLDGIRQPGDPIGSTLTGRQLEVLTLLARGLTNREIALKLNVTSHTARHHVSEILEKLNAANRAEAVAIALQRGLIKE